MHLRQDGRLLQGPGEKEPPESWMRVFLGSLGFEVGNSINVLLVLSVFIHVELKKKKKKKKAGDGVYQATFLLHFPPLCSKQDTASHPRPFLISERKFPPASSLGLFLSSWVTWKGFKLLP